MENSGSEKIWMKKKSQQSTKHFHKVIKSRHLLKVEIELDNQWGDFLVIEMFQARVKIA